MSQHSPAALMCIRLSPPPPSKKDRRLKVTYSKDRDERKTRIEKRCSQIWVFFTKSRSRVLPVCKGQTIHFTWRCQ